MGRRSWQQVCLARKRAGGGEGDASVEGDAREGAAPAAQCLPEGEATR